MKYLLMIGLILTVACEATESIVAELSNEELLFLYEEEKVALDIYNHFEELYGITPYVHISDSEQSHFERMEELLLSKGVLDEHSVIRTEPGVFINSELQTLYDDLKARGDESLLEALNVSAFIEEHDISGLEELAAQTSDSEVEEVMISLASASKNHLRAFVRNLDMREVTYEPVLLDESYYNTIINARQQCCQDGGNGKGNGRSAKKECNH